MKILTVDIDGTYIRYACMDEYKNIDRRGKIFTPQEGRTELIEAIARLYEAVGDAEGIAISMPGIIDSANGYCRMGGALKYNDDFYFRHALYERCRTKIHVENNAKCAAMAEAAVGSLMDVADGFFLVFSTMPKCLGRHFSVLKGTLATRTPMVQPTTIMALGPSTKFISLLMSSWGKPSMPIRMNAMDKTSPIK